MNGIADLVFLSSVLITAIPPSEAPDAGRVIVEAPAGNVEGRHQRGIDAFVGIPYALPPVGPLRWRPPQPQPTWTGVRQATSFGNDCPQLRIAEDATPSIQPMSEDCLTLNVWRPRGAKHLPVMVWIHGGGFIMGSSASPVVDGSNLARLGVILVSFNYRLGRFGFFAHPSLSAEQGGRPVANFAFQDMIAALGWVRANIAAFGGDPANVTIFGESSGGAAVNFLMASPEASGLFAKAIVQSGANRDLFAKMDQDRPWRVSAHKAGIAFAASAGLTDATADQLRALPTDTIQGKLTFGDPQVDRFSGPVIDGDTVLDDPVIRFASRHVPAVPYLVGSTGHELSEEPYAPLIIDAIEKYAPPAALAELKRAYGDPMDRAVIDDYLFGEAARGYARMMAARGSPAWHYRFDYVAEGKRAKRGAANHASEIAYLFGNLPQGATAGDAAIAKVMGDYWTNFAKTSDPNGGDLLRWPSAKSGDAMLVIANDGARAGRSNDPRLDAVERAQLIRRQ